MSKTTKPKSSAENAFKRNLSQALNAKRLKKKDKIKNNQNNLPKEDSEDEELLLESVQDIIDNEDMDLAEIPTKKSRKRKVDEIGESIKSSGLETEYATQQYKEKTSKKMVVDLLPIKAKDGAIITRTTEVDYKPKPSTEEDQASDDEGDEDEQNAEVEDSDEDILQDVAGKADSDDEANAERIISTADLLIRREQEVERQKYRIGIICSGILEKPEDKMKNFSALFDLMEEFNESGGRNLYSIRKLAIISIAEVFKDILPEYRVGQVDTKMTTGKCILELVYI